MSPPSKFTDNRAAASVDRLVTLRVFAINERFGRCPSVITPPLIHPSADVAPPIRKLMCLTRIVVTPCSSHRRRCCFASRRAAADDQDRDADHVLCPAANFSACECAAVPSPDAVLLAVYGPASKSLSIAPISRSLVKSPSVSSLRVGVSVNVATVASRPYAPSRMSR